MLNCLSLMRLKLGGFSVLIVVLLLVGFNLLIAIQVNDAHRVPVARGAAPTLGMGRLCRFIDVRAP